MITGCALAQHCYNGDVRFLWLHISLNFRNALINLDCWACNSWSKDFQPYHNGSRCISDRLSLTYIIKWAKCHRPWRAVICRRCSCGWYCAGAGCCCRRRRRRPQRCRCCQRRYKPVTPLLQLTALYVLIFRVHLTLCICRHYL